MFFTDDSPLHANGNPSRHLPANPKPLRLPEASQAQDGSVLASLMKQDLQFGAFTKKHGMTIGKGTKEVLAGPRSPGSSPRVLGDKVGGRWGDEGPGVC
jgi:hypothetical protein